MTKRWNHYGLFLTLAFACPINAATSALAQDARPAVKKWRPHEGTYAVPGEGFVETCGEFGDLIVRLREKEISGHEWSCKVGKLTDTGPGAIKIQMTCDDYNLAEDLKKPEGTRFKEIIVLKKIDENSISGRKTVDGKFKDPEFKAVYCPEEAQQMYRDAGKKDAEGEQTESGQKLSAFEIKRGAVQYQLRTAQWHPRDGVYASPGADFNDRCTRSGDAVIELDQIAISSGASHCEVASVESASQDSIRLDTRCGLEPGASRMVARTIGSQIVFVPMGSEKIVITKNGDQTIVLQKSSNGEFSEPAQPLAYCPEAAQRAYADSKKAK